MIKVTCARCLGSGNYSFNLKDGTMCYGCKGTGYTYTTQGAINAAAKRKETSEIRQAEEAKAHTENDRMAAGKLILLRKIYKNDKRMVTLDNIPEQYHYMHLLEWAKKDGI